jgi:predicted DNA-binding transcriptional regulator YafY
MRDDSSLRRQWILLRSLSASRLGMTVREMAAEAGMNEKTIRRDLDLFRRVGFALEESIGEFGRKKWKLKANGSPPTLSFPFDEAAALYMGRRLLEPLAGTLFWEAAQNAFRKIRASLSDPVLEYLDRFSGFFHQTASGASNYAAKSRLIDDLTRAYEESKAIHILYQSDRATEPAFRDVYPYGVIYYRGSLYLVALDPQEDKLKHYKVDRIEEVDVSTFPFRRPADFDLQSHLSGALGIFQGDGDVAVKIRFMPAVVRYVLEGRWHASQRLTKQRDGTLLAEFQLSCTEEIKSWVLGFGRKAVVLEPDELREEIAHELRAMCDAHEAAPIQSRRR